MDSRGGYVLKILYVETKECGPLGGVPWARPLDPPMLNPGHIFLQKFELQFVFLRRMLGLLTLAGGVGILLYVLPHIIYPLEGKTSSVQGNQTTQTDHLCVTGELIR